METLHAPASALTISCIALRELDADQVRELRDLTFGCRGQLQETFDRTLMCKQIHPNRNAYVVVAQKMGEIVGWALVHATGLRYRQRPRSRSFVYGCVEWYCWLFVDKDHRRQGIGRQLITQATHEASARGLDGLLVKPCSDENARFFTRMHTDGAAIRWDEWDHPAKYLKELPSQLA